jgi:hypothetical protein
MVSDKSRERMGLALIKLGGTASALLYLRFRQSAIAFGACPKFSRLRRHFLGTAKTQWSSILLFLKEPVKCDTRISSTWGA